MFNCFSSQSLNLPPTSSMVKPVTAKPNFWHQLVLLWGSTMTMANSSTGNIRAGSQFQKFGPQPSRQGVWQHAHRHAAREVAESSTSWSAVSRRDRLSGQWQASSNKATPPNVFKSFYSLVTKDSNQWTCGGHAHSNYCVNSQNFLFPFCVSFCSLPWLAWHCLHTPGWPWSDKRPTCLCSQVLV